jgi:hypothetical protein
MERSLLDGVRSSGFAVHAAVHAMPATGAKSLTLLATSEDSQSSNPGSIPGSATNQHPLTPANSAGFVWDEKVDGARWRQKAPTVDTQWPQEISGLSGGMHSHNARSNSSGGLREGSTRRCSCHRGRSGGPRRFDPVRWSGMCLIASAFPAILSPTCGSVSLGGDHI